jgi:hypothetical protein
MIPAIIPYTIAMNKWEFTIAIAVVATGELCEMLIDDVVAYSSHPHKFVLTVINAVKHTNIQKNIFEQTLPAESHFVGDSGICGGDTASSSVCVSISIYSTIKFINLFLFAHLYRCMS